MSTNDPSEEKDLKNIALQAAQEFSADEVKEQAEREEEKDLDQSNDKMWLGIKSLAILICVVFIGIQAPHLYSLSQEAKKPAKTGNFVTDAKTDQCIHNLWLISSQLQRKQSYEQNPVCPLSKSAYVFSTEDEITTARCPNPRSHGFSTILVSNRKPMPLLIK